MKRAANLSVDAELLDKARKLKINLSQLLEQALREKVRAKEGEKWLEENKGAIESYNRWVAENGVFSDGVRRF